MTCKCAFEKCTLLTLEPPFNMFRYVEVIFPTCQFIVSSSITVELKLNRWSVQYCLPNKLIILKIFSFQQPTSEKQNKVAAPFRIWCQEKLDCFLVLSQNNLGRPVSRGIQLAIMINVVHLIQKPANQKII